VTVVDPADTIGARKFALGNFAPFYGKYQVTEGFAELDVPLLKDKGVQSLAFNAAARVTDYSTSGTVETWKFGLTSQIEDNIRLRGTISRDIRAPNLNELFAGGAASTNSAVDPHTGINVPIYTVAGGNSKLTPEIGNTKSFGAVLTPTFIPRFSASADFYDIKITNAIVTVGAANILTRCNAGETVYCSQLVFAGPVGPAGPALSQINTSPINASAESSRGIDFQADYNHELLDGSMSYRLRGNYIMQQTRTLFGVTQRCDGSNGVDGGLCTGVPKLRGTLSGTYEQGPASFTLQTRYIGSSKLGFYWTSKDVDKNTVPALAYFDLRASYNIQDNFQVFANMDNVMDQAPPNIPASAGNTGSAIYYFTAVRAGVWDVIGRTFRVGLRAQF
jgi:outer membrane receptor protein involved in Fe transport